MSRFQSFNQQQTPTRVSKRSSTDRMYVDYRDIEAMERCLTPNGKIQSRKRTGLSAQEQRMLAQAVKRARYMALLPYTGATV